VLGGLISPMDGIGPDSLEIATFIERLKVNRINEVIMALNSTPEGDTTNYYIFKKISSFDLKVTIPARGVSVGSELQFVDEITLGRSIQNRIDFQS
jgi:recombination protein RecR